MGATWVKKGVSLLRVKRGPVTICRYLSGVPNIRRFMCCFKCGLRPSN